MNPLNRRMFRQPGMSRQPAGILASSPQLANTVANRQPVRMSNGGTNTYTAAVQRAVQAGDKRALQELAKPVNYGAAARTPDGQNALRLARQAIAQSTRISTDTAVDAPVSDAERMAANRSNLAALRAAQGLNQGATVPATTDDAPSILDRGIAAAKSAISGDYMRPLTDAIVRGVKDDASSIASVFNADTRMSPANVAARARIPMMDDNVDDAAMAQVITDRKIERDTASEFVPKTEAEKLADNTFGRGRSVSTLDPGAEAEAAAALSGTTIDPVTQDPGVRAGITGIEPPKIEPPKTEPPKKGKKTAVEAAIDLAVSNETADAEAEKTVIGAKSSENINAAIASALETQQSDASDKDKAETTDSILGITAKTRKERVKARQALIKEILGEDEAKDMRTDANYNMIMLGLLMATGQSENAITNFAEAAKVTLGNVAKVKGEKAEAKRKEDRAIALKAIDEIGAEISVEEKRAYENLIRADEQQFQKDLQEQRDVAALERLDRQLTSTEELKIKEFKFKKELNNRTFRQNISMLGIKAENAEALQQMQNEFTLELQELKNQEDSAVIKTARILQASNPKKYPTLDDAYAATKALSTTRPTDEQQRYNRLVASGMLPSQAIIFAQTGVTTEMFKQMGVEKAQEAIGGLMGGGQTAAPATITISDLPQSEQDKILAFEVGAPIKTKQGNYIRTNAGTLVPVR